MSGTVAVIADAAARYTFFSQCLSVLRFPVNTEIDWRIGADRARSRNSLVKASLERGSEWILFLDDDHSFDRELLTRLLSRDQPVVGSLYLRRAAPFYPIAYAERDEKGHWMPLDLTECPKEGLVQVAGVGTGGMLVRSEVFKELGDIDWFIHTTEQSEDLHFCGLCKDAGIPVFVDLDSALGHIAPAVIVPQWSEEDGWCATLAFSMSTSIMLPIEPPVAEQEKQ